MISILLLLLATVGRLSANRYALHELVYYHSQDIFNGEHLRDVLFDSHLDRTLRHALIIFFSQIEGCAEAVDAIRTSVDEHPPADVMSIYAHDVTSWEKAAWYNPVKPEKPLREWFDLNTRQWTCPMIIFVPRGSSHERKCKVFESGNAVEWAWQQIHSTITVSNKLSKAVTVTGIRYTTREEHVVDANSDFTFKFYEGSFVTTRDSQDISFGTYIVNNSSLSIVIKPSSNAETTINELAQLQQQQIITHYIKIHQLHHRACEVMRNYHQPNFVHNYTEQGWQQLATPAWIHDKLMMIYKNEYVLRKCEDLDPLDTSINFKDVPTFTINIGKPTQKKIANGVRPLVEAFCNCTVELTRFEGIREFYYGSIMPMHAKTVESNAFTVMIRMTKGEPVSGEWPLEVITFDGERENISLEAGEMLIFEGTKLIHGWPKAFRGSTYSICQLHFRPSSGWRYTTYYPNLGWFELQMDNGDYQKQIRSKQDVDPGLWRESEFKANDKFKVKQAKPVLTTRSRINPRARSKTKINVSSQKAQDAPQEASQEAPQEASHSEL